MGAQGKNAVIDISVSLATRILRKLSIAMASRTFTCVLIACYLLTGVESYRQKQEVDDKLKDRRGLAEIKQMVLDRTVEKKEPAPPPPPPAAVHCQGTWSSWSTCTATCGSGTKTQTFTVSRWPAHGGRGCPNPSTRTQKCNENPCPTPKPAVVVDKLEENDSPCD